MKKGIVPCPSTVEIITDSENIDEYFRDITVEELGIIIHPYGDFIIEATFDDRSIEEMVDKDLDFKYERRQYFDKSTTLLQFLEWITSDHCYGYFEGISDKGELLWGT